MAKVSVVITCYNLGCYLDEAVTSVLSQSYDDYEIIVVDDGSTDVATCELLHDYQRPRTRLIRTSNRGVAAARNRGIREATGEYILNLDGDDRIASNYMKQATQVLDQHCNVGVVYGGAEFFGALQGEWSLPEFSLPHMLLDNQIFSAAFFRREDWLTVNGYNETMQAGWEDWDFWLKLLTLGREVVRLPGILFFYRIRSGSRERSLGSLTKCFLMFRLVLQHPGLYIRSAGEISRILCCGDRRRPAVIKVMKS